MNLYIHNTLTNKKELFVPHKKNKVNMYVCGPTVYSNPHIGNARAALIGDLYFRILSELFSEVTYIRNLTDVDDKIIAQSKNVVIPKQFEKYQKLSLNSISVEIIYLSMGLIDLYIISKDEYDMFLDCILVAKESGILAEIHNEYIILANQNNLKNINL